MGIDSPRGLFVYELGVARSMELTSTSVYGFLKGRVTDPELMQILTDLEQHKRQMVDNLNACMTAVNATSQQIPSPSIDGLRERFTIFLKTKPSTQAVDVYALGIAARIKQSGIIAYQELLALAEVLNEPTCKQRLTENLTMKREYAAKLTKHSSEMRRQLQITAPV